LHTSGRIGSGTEENDAEEDCFGVPEEP